MVQSTLIKSLLLALVAGLVTLGGVEVASRLLVEPDERGHGAIMGIVLPPYRIVVPSQAEATDRSAPYRDLVVDGQPITIGDVAGYHRYDAVLGYTHQLNARSVNGWWQSNNIGAREAAPTPEQAPSGRERWLLVGESFAHGSSLQAHQGWASIVEEEAPSLDVVNLAVDGYSMAQAYLRYQPFANRLEHHGVMLMFVPDVDLWRDVNTLRTLGEPWKVQAVMPRFVIDGEGSLELVPSPYSAAGELLAANADGLSDGLRDHLRRFDRFYFPFEYGEVPVLGRLVTFKLAAVAYGGYARSALRRELREPGSEALRVSRAVFAALHRSATAHHRQFLLLVLPTANDLRRFREEDGYPEQWAELLRFVCEGPWRCIDLSGALRQPETIDAGPDGNHFGPRTNRAIAAAVRAAIAGSGTAPVSTVRIDQ